MKTQGVTLSGRAPNHTETQKELKRPKSNSKVTRADRPQGDLKIDSNVTPDCIFESFLSNF